MHEQMSSIVYTQTHSHTQAHLVSYTLRPPSLSLDVFEFG